jgi:hypothetical protein
LIFFLQIRTRHGFGDGAPFMRLIFRGVIRRFSSDQPWWSIARSRRLRVYISLGRLFAFLADYECNRDFSLTAKRLCQ